MGADKQTDKVFFLPGNHLYPAQLLNAYRDTTIVMIEDAAICQRRPYHQQKLALMLSAMREHAVALRSAGHRVEYFPLAAEQTLTSALKQVCASLSTRTLYTFEVYDQSLTRLLTNFCNTHELEWHTAGNPAFLTQSADFAGYANGKKQLRMGDFYKKQRLGLNILVDRDQNPIGGQWSFDAENRKKLPRTQPLPTLNQIEHSDVTASTILEVADRFSSHPGDANGLWVPTTRAGAIAWLQTFIEQRLLGFGTYEDAITTRSAVLFHSALSPMLNLGLLTPSEIVAAVLEAAESQGIPLNDVEGIIRQVIGWREFMHGVYDQFGSTMRRRNTRGQERTLSRHWHDGNTGIPPLDAAIKHQRDLGWNHHINRLMVIANLMNLCEIEPDQVYEYFMTYYLDAYDWVMVPNVYGMGLNSDGGIFATKPYICGSNYLLKMSDFKRGDWCDVVDGLYWRFISNNMEELRKNARLSVFASGLNRLADEKKERIFSAAEHFLERCTVVE